MKGDKTIQSVTPIAAANIKQLQDRIVSGYPDKSTVERSQLHNKKICEKTDSNGELFFGDTEFTDIQLAMIDVAEIQLNEIKKLTEGKDVSIVSLWRASTYAMKMANDIIPDVNLVGFDIHRQETVDADGKHNVSAVNDGFSGHLNTENPNEQIFVYDHMLATGSSIISALNALRDKNVDMKKVSIMATFTTPEGVNAIKSKYPNIEIHSLIQSRACDENKYITDPGCGDLGDLLFDAMNLKEFSNVAKDASREVHRDKNGQVYKRSYNHDTYQKLLDRFERTAKVTAEGHRESMYSYKYADHVNQKSKDEGNVADVGGVKAIKNKKELEKFNKDNANKPENDRDKFVSELRELIHNRWKLIGDRQSQNVGEIKETRATGSAEKASSIAKINQAAQSVNAMPQSKKDEMKQRSVEKLTKTNAEKLSDEKARMKREMNSLNTVR